MSIPLTGLLFLIVLIRTIYSTREFRNDLTLKMIYRDSPDSHLYNPNQTEDQRIQNLIRISKSRYESISAATNNMSAHSLIHTEDILYMVQLGIGQFRGSVPYLTYYLVMDTGSDLTWTQCEGCRTCFRQRDAYFPRSRSRTYEPFSCNTCPTTSRCRQDHCTISVSYGDNSNVNCILARESFTFGSDGNVKTFTNLTFGCGIEMHVPSLETFPNNTISGILGMGCGSNSFANQMKTRGLGIFSYCLRPIGTPPQPSTPMFLRITDHIQVGGMVSTPFRVVANRPFYYVNLLHLSVASTRLRLANDVFALKPDNSGGVVIDSGAAVSYIVPEAFEVLQNSIAAYIQSKNQNMVKVSGQGGFETCWGGPRDLSRVNLPNITFHFENADMVVQPKSVFFIGTTRHPEHSVYCLAMHRGTHDKGVSLIGAYQQGNQRIIYDLNRHQLSFKADDCSHNN